MSISARREPGPSRVRRPGRRAAAGRARPREPGSAAGTARALPPRRAGFAAVAERGERLTQAVEGVGDLEGVAAVAVERERPPVVRDRGLVVAGAALDVAEAVQGVRLGVRVAVAAVQSQRGLAVASRGFVLADLGGQPAHLVELARLPHRLAEGAEQLQCPRGVVQRPPVVATQLPDPRKPVLGEALLGLLAGALSERDGFPQVPDGFVVPAEVRLDVGEQPVRAARRDRVGQVRGGVQCGPPHRQPVGQHAPPVLEGVQAPRELPHDVVPPGGRGGALGRQEVRVLAVEPVQRGRVVAQRVRRAGGGERDRLAVRVQVPVGGVRGVEVAAEHAPQGRFPLGRAKLVPGGRRGVVADQVVHGVAPARPPAEQRSLLQHGQRLRGPLRGRTGEGGRGGQPDVGPGRDAEQGEHRPLLAREGPQRPRKDGGQAHARVFVVEGVEADVPQLGGELRERDVRARVRVAAHDRQRQRVAPAQADQVLGRLRFGREPGRAQALGQQRPGFAVAEDVQLQVPGAVARDQRRQVAAAGHDGRARGAVRQQRDHLVRVGRVVQHHQYPLARDELPVQRGPGFRVGRDPGGCDAQRTEEAPHHDRRFQRGTRRGEAVQVGEQPSVREAVAVGGRPVQHQPGLADPAGPGERGDLHHGPFVRVAGQRRELARAADERRRCRGEPVRDRGRVLAGQLGITAQDPLVQLPQRRAGIGAQLLGEPVPEPLVVLEGLGLAAAAVQAQHDLTGEPLVERVFRGPRRQVGEQLGVPSPAQPHVGVVEPRRPPFGAQGPAQVTGPRRVQIGEGVAAPQPERPLEQGLGFVVPGFARFGHEPAEPVQVDGIGVDLRDVAAGEPPDLQPRAGGRMPQAGQVAVQRLPRAQRRAVRPHPVDQLVDRHQPVRVGQQRRQHGPLPRRPELDRLAVHPGLDRAQQPEFHHRASPRPRIRPARSSRLQGVRKVAGARWGNTGRPAGPVPSRGWHGSRRAARELSP